MRNTALRPQRAFTLIELLAVMSIIIVLISASTSALRLMISGGGAAGGIYEINALLELARNEAMTRQTYVWVGIENVNNGGNQEVQLAVVYSLDGTSSAALADPSGHAIPNAPLGRIGTVLHVKNVALRDWASLHAGIHKQFEPRGSQEPPKDVCSNDSKAAFVVAKTEFAGQTLTFTPRGEVMLLGSPGSYDQYQSFIGVNICDSHGSTITAQANEASVVIDGSTGSSTIFQQQ